MDIKNFRSYQPDFHQGALKDLIDLADLSLAEGCDEWFGNHKYDVNIWDANSLTPDSNMKGAVYVVVDGQTDIHNIVAEFQIV